MWPLWIAALFHLAAFQGLEHDSREVSQGILQGLQDRMENETSTHGRSTWLVSTTAPLLTVQSSTDYKARRLKAPTITVRAENGTCQALLRCAVPGEEAGNLNFTWSQVNGSVVLSRAQTLNITQKPQRGTMDYVCTVGSQAGERSSMVSLEKHCQSADSGTKTDPPVTSKYHSASFYAKYIAPLLIVLVVLLVLFLMYRRKRGREIHSSMESINESSDSDEEVGPSVDQTAEVSFLPEGVKPLPQDNTSIAEAAVSNREKASDTPKQLPTQA
ncbi:uncharacterized protein LOC116520091 [Thamnophis elegans]|uniref:uncharacterized protein LOC116520091 n=1 Tax=Thamnophis elegans TaxID=35005 RepID=UPI00137910EA|nr:uncharacterized protein LOC116520091 [Thamnophis elegans]